MTYRDSSGKPGGFVVDVLNEAARRAGITLVWRDVGDMQANDNALQRGELDLVAGVDTPDRRRMFYVSEPWWSSELIALVPASSTIRQDADLYGRRLAVPSTGLAEVAKRYGKTNVVRKDSAVQAAEAACTGAADAAIIASLYLRELLFAGSSACNGISVRTVDCQTRVDYVLIARREAAKTAVKLRSRLDEITADGTLAAIATRHPPVSTPTATRLADLLRLRLERQIVLISLGAAVVILLLGATLVFKQYRSRARLRAANAQLQEDLLARERAEAALRQSEARFRALFDSAPQGVVAFNRSGAIAFANRRLEDMFGHSREQFVGKNIDVLLPERLRHTQGKDGSPLPPKSESSGLRADGTEFPIEISVGAVETEEGLTLAFITDISDRAALQKQFLEAQKLESLGQLAGGVAHDFNNLLTVISGYSQMLMDQSPAQDKHREAVEQISQAANLAASLTRQLLLFSRRQMAITKTFALNELVENLKKMLRRLIGEDVELTLSLDPNVGLIRADPTHIEQIVLNLVINARDAMPQGGKLAIETSQIHVLEDFASSRPELSRGSYVVLRVCDSGVGMPPEVKAHLFEPFFTTKERGKGTGLGLSTVYGIVKQSGGAIFVNSEPGYGTVFEILFPLAEASAEQRKKQSKTDLEGLTGFETILVAEDEPGVRKFIQEVLRSHGYTVLLAANGREALEISQRRLAQIDLLLSDVVMPEMGGLELAERFCISHPRAAILHMSGYSDRPWRRDMTAHFIEKPFTPSALLRAVRKVLDTSKSNTAGFDPSQA